MNRSKQKGFTLMELIFVVVGGASIVGVVAFLIVAWHFVSKLW